MAEKKGVFSKVGSWFKDTTEKVLTAKERFSAAIKRPEIVEPYLNGIDSFFLNEDVMKSFSKDNKEAGGSEKFRRIMKKHFVNDIFGLFYNDKEEMKFSKRTEWNDFRYKLLEKVNKSGIKILSRKSTFASTLFTQEIAKYFYELYKDLTPEQMEEMEKMMGGGEGQDEGEEGDEEGKGNMAGGGAGKGTTNSAVRETLERLLDSAKSDQMLEQAIKNVEKKVDMMEQSGIEVNETNAREMVGKVDVLEKHRADITQLNISKEGILKAVKKIMDRSTSYFSARYKVDEDDLYSCENLNEVEGLELLHPVFRRGRINDVIAHHRRYFGKFDLYVDNSGSMGSSAGLPGHSNVSCMLLAKAIAMRMKRMDILNDLYEFQDSVTKVESTELAILDMCARGGTSITSVANSVTKSEKNSICLTDACDMPGVYLDNLAFVGVNGINFHEFRGSEVGRRYIENGQCFAFDGHDALLVTMTN